MSDAISVVIATCNRQAVLERGLEHLQRQTVPMSRWEVIVVDDGSTDGTDQMVMAAKNRLGLPLRYLPHENRGPGFTQNVGIREARFGLILLLADDIWPHPQLLAEHLSSHQEHPESCLAVLGNVQQSPELPPTALQRVWDPFRYAQRFHGCHELEGYYFHACNISVKKSFLLEHGLFQERSAVAHEDIELGYRLSQQGLRIVFNERAMADHYHQETLAKICQRAYERGYHFDLLTESLPGPLVYPLYKVLSPEAGWRAYLKMLPRECARRAAFNHFTVRWFWQPFIERADRNWLGRTVTRGFSCRGVAGYHLRAGWRAKRAGRPFR